jgi:hypothetical protein
LAVERSVLNGGASPANCARKMAGPLIVRMSCHFAMLRR